MFLTVFCAGTPESAFDSLLILDSFTLRSWDLVWLFFTTSLKYSFLLLDSIYLAYLRSFLSSSKAVLSRSYSFMVSGLTYGKIFGVFAFDEFYFWSRIIRELLEEFFYIPLEFDSFFCWMFWFLSLYGNERWTSLSNSSCCLRASWVSISLIRAVCFSLISRTRAASYLSRTFSRRIIF